MPKLSKSDTYGPGTVLRRAKGAIVPPSMRRVLLERLMKKPEKGHPLAGCDVQQSKDGMVDCLKRAGFHCTEALYLHETFAYVFSQQHIALRYRIDASPEQCDILVAVVSKRGWMSAISRTESSPYTVSKGIMTLKNPVTTNQITELLTPTSPTGSQSTSSLVPKEITDPNAESSPHGFSPTGTASAGSSNITDALPKSTTSSASDFVGEPARGFPSPGQGTSTRPLSSETSPVESGIGGQPTEKSSRTRSSPIQPARVSPTSTAPPSRGSADPFDDLLNGFGRMGFQPVPTEREYKPTRAGDTTPGLHAMSPPPTTSSAAPSKPTFPSFSLPKTSAKGETLNAFGVPISPSKTKSPSPGGTSTSSQLGLESTLAGAFAALATLPNPGAGAASVFNSRPPIPPGAKKPTSLNHSDRAASQASDAADWKA